MKNTNKKLVIAVIALAVALACTLGVAVAWMTAETQEIVNTFTVGKVAITLEEVGAVANAQTYENIKPGDVLDKEATITVDGASEDCYLYIRVDVENNTVGGKTILEWEIAEGWTALDGVDEVYYRVVNKADAKKAFNVIQTTEDTPQLNKLIVNDELSSTDCAAIADLSITLTGYAVQKTAGATAKDAWTATFGAP